MKRKKGDRAPGTCEWILGTEELTAWLASGRTAGPESQATEVLWLHGYPGTGKSTMAIFLAEELSTVFSTTDGKTLTYFFCDSNFDNRKTATSVVRGLLLQLVQQHPQLLDYLLPKYNERGADLIIQVIRRSLDDIYGRRRRPEYGRKYCIIDALDECERESQEILLRQFQESFQSRSVTSNIRILLTSRPYCEIGEYLEAFANKDLASFSETKRDIDRCIEERVADLAKRKYYTNKVKGQVSNMLRDKAEGTFLWIGLACEELKDIPSKDAVQALQNMPRGLHSLYKRLLDTALGQDTATADIIRRILSFIALSLEPLSVLELSEACQLHQEEEDLATRIQFTREQIASCRLMVIIQDEKVLLLHKSVKDYLVGVGSGYFIDEFEAHAELAFRCVDLLIDQFHGSRLSNNGFCSYAHQNWATHAHMAQSKFEVRQSQAEFFGINSPCREQWLQHLRSDLHHRWYHYGEIPKEFSILHVAGRWGVPVLVDYISRSDDPNHEPGKLSGFIDCVDASGKTPLEEAASSRYADVFSVLLGLEAKLTIQVVRAAAGNRSNGKELMTLLLDRRGDEIIITEEVVKAAAGNDKKVMALLRDRRGDEVTITEAVVMAAARNYRNGEEVMALLLDRRGDEITITKEMVSIIARSFGKKVMALLLDRQGDKITITKEVVNAAAWNFRSGEEVMALLLDRRGDEIIITEDVVRAAAKNDKKVMALLLDRRGDKITISEEVVKAAAGNYRNGEEVVWRCFSTGGETRLPSLRM